MTSLLVAAALFLIVYPTLYKLLGQSPKTGFKIAVIAVLIGMVLKIIGGW